MNKMINICGTSINLNTELLIATLFPLLTVYVVYRLGLRAYFKQKEFENVRNRYLENGVELVITQIDYILGIQRHNWELMLRTTRQYREQESQVSMEDFFNQFREVNQDNFQLGPIYKTQTLLNDDVLWRAYQAAFAFVSSTNIEIKSDFAGTLNNLLNSPHNADKLGFIQQVEEQAKQNNLKANNFYLILDPLHKLSEIVEDGKHTFKSIHTIHKTKKIKQIVSELLKLFPENG